MAGVVFKGEGVRVAVPAGLLEAMGGLADARRPNETGGVLYGIRRRRSILQVGVVGFLPAPPDSTSGPNFFERGVEGLAEAWAPIEEAGYCYLGEWHSHPFSLPDPSLQDYESLGSVVNDADYGSPPFVFGLILGADLSLGGEWRIGGFYVEQGGSGVLRATRG